MKARTSRPRARQASQGLIVGVVILVLAQVSFGYSVLSHEALIDAAWEGHIKPLLLQRSPGASAEELREAYAYSYGGALIQDLGYYPFGNKFFSDLTHYVRSGGFVAALLAEAQDLNECAFALGALEHYASDNSGHPIAVNRSVPLLYPKLRSKYGAEVTYEDSPSAHLKTEFGFDVAQVARGSYAPLAYHNFIGFKVSKPALQRAFRRTYGLELKQVFASVDLALGTYRRSVSTIIPEVTKVAWEMKKDELTKATPGLTREKFVYRLSRASYEKEWGREYQKPGVWATALSFLLRVVPKVGPLKALKFKPPTAEAERLFTASFNSSLDRFRALLDEVARGGPELPNKNLDTGQPTRPGEYWLADEAYAKLLRKLAEDKFKGMTPELRDHLLAFFHDGQTPAKNKPGRDEWQRTQRALAALKAMQQ